MQNKPISTNSTINSLSRKTLTIHPFILTYSSPRYLEFKNPQKPLEKCQTHLESILHGYRSRRHQRWIPCFLKSRDQAPSPAEIVALSDPDVMHSEQLPVKVENRVTVYEI